MTVRAVFFDLYNTLARFDPPRHEIQQRAASRFGLELAVEGVDRGYLHADALMAVQKASRPLRQMSSAEQDLFFARYEQAILNAAGHTVDLETASAVWNEVRRQRYGLKLFDDVLTALDALRSGGRVVGVISNMDRPGDAVAASLGLEGHVDTVVTSLEAGAEKPHAPIFLMALELVASPAGEAVHVGDQLEADVEGASRAGIRPILMDRYQDHAGYAAHPRIETLSELPTLLDGM